VATLATSPQAAAAFETIRDAWDDTDEYSPAALRAMIDRFLAQFPTTPGAARARCARARRDEAGRLRDGDAQIAMTARVPPGTAQDLRTVARASDGAWA